MTIFDLLFLLAILASLVTLVVAVVRALRGHRRSACKILRIYGMCALGYFTVGVAVAFLKPQRLIPKEDPWCFDDWCLTVGDVSRTPGHQTTSYRVDLRISSSAGRIAQRANGAWIYLIDDQGRLYSPDPDPSAVPLDTLLQPHQSVATSRTFQVPVDVHGLGLITGHGGSYCGQEIF